MRAFVVTIETPHRRTVQVVADRSEDAARRTIGARLPWELACKVTR